MKLGQALIAGALLLAASPAAAGDPDGRIQLKLLGTAVLPDGRIDAVKANALGAPAGTDTRVDDNLVPTVAAEYFLSPAFSIETIAGVTKHSVTGAGALGGAKLITNAAVVPATVTAKLHLRTGGAVKPYVGAGPSYFLIFGEDPDTDARALGVTRVHLSDELGFALQGGVDVAVDKKGLALSLDAKRYFTGTTASFYAGRTLQLRTEHKLDPWVLSAGLAFRF